VVRKRGGYLEDRWSVKTRLGSVAGKPSDFVNPVSALLSKGDLLSYACVSATRTHRCMARGKDHGKSLARRGFDAKGQPLRRRGSNSPVRARFNELLEGTVSVKE